MDTVFPHSTAMDATPTEGDLVEIANEALNAFFGVVVDHLNYLYPEGTTSGDVDPGASIEQERVALDWIKSFAYNHPTIAAATEAQYGHAEDCDCATCSVPKASH